MPEKIFSRFARVQRTFQLNMLFGENFSEVGLISQYRNKNYGEGDNTCALIQVTHGAGVSAGTASFLLAGEDGYAKGLFGIYEDGLVALQTDKINGKSVSWHSNGDGTYTLIGE